MSSLREKFRATSLAELENQQKEVDSMFKGGGGDYLNLEVGRNRIRIYPKHPIEGALFIYPKGVHFLPLEKVDDDGKKSISRRPVWSGLLHSEHKRCIIDQYISRVYLLAKEITDKKAREKFLFRMTGNMKTSITMSRTWPTYANLIKGTQKQFGILEIKNSVKSQMDSLAANLDDGPSMITTDPYTDPDTGRCLLVTYDDKATQMSDYYKTGIDINGPTPLTDAELEAFSEVTPLRDLYVNVYKRKDFLLALEGLKRFDEEEDDYNIFAQESWQDLVAEFNELYPEDEEETTTSKPKGEPLKQTPKAEAPIKETPKAEVEKPAAPIKKDMSWLKDIEEMDKNELIQYIKDTDMPIRVLPSDTEDDIRGLIKREQALQGVTSPKSVAKEEAPAETGTEIPDNPLDFLKSKL